MVDRVRPLKIEDSGSGTETDFFPTETNPHEDYIDTRGLTLQDASSNDEVVRVEREATTSKLKFYDTNYPSGKTLAELATAGSGVLEATHKALRQLIHFIDEGPGDGFASGAYKEISGGAFPTSIIWWTSAAKTHKIVEKTVTRSGGGATNVAPTPVVWRIYDVDGVTVLATISDAIVYSGVFETGRTRTIT